MSLHRSLVLKSSLKRVRNVFTREERIAILEKQGKWKEGSSVYRLPKVKGEMKIKKVKAEKKPAAEAAPATAATTETATE